MKKTKQQEGGAATDGARRKTGFSVRGAETAAAPERHDTTAAAADTQRKGGGPIVGLV